MIPEVFRLHTVITIHDTEAIIISLRKPPSIKCYEHEQTQADEAFCSAFHGKEREGESRRLAFCDKWLSDSFMDLNLDIEEVNQYIARMAFT